MNISILVLATISCVLVPDILCFLRNRRRRGLSSQKLAPPALSIFEEAELLVGRFERLSGVRTDEDEHPWYLHVAYANNAQLVFWEFANIVVLAICIKPWFR